MTIPLIILIIAAWVVGGQKFKWLFRFILVPIFLGLGIALRGHPWLGLLIIPVAQVLRLGYGNFEEGEKNSFLGSILRDKQGALVRMLWGLIVALSISLPILWSKESAFFWGKAILYVLGNGLIGFGVSKLRFPVLLTDVLVGAGIASILIFL